MQPNPLSTIARLCEIVREHAKQPLQTILDEAAEWEFLSSLYEAKGDCQAAAAALREAEACYARIPSLESEYSDLPVERPHKPRGGRQYGRLHQRRGGQRHYRTDFSEERREKMARLGL